MHLFLHIWIGYFEVSRIYHNLFSILRVPIFHTLPLVNINFTFRSDILLACLVLKLLFYSPQGGWNSLCINKRKMVYWKLKCYTEITRQTFWFVCLGFYVPLGNFSIFHHYRWRASNSELYSGLVANGPRPWRSGLERWSCQLKVGCSNPSRDRPKS